MLKYDMVKTLPPQAVAAYKLLIKEASSPMTAKKLAENLGILPHSIYRSLASLTQFGMVEELSVHPKKFQAKTPSSAISTYLLVYKNWFEKHFSAPETPDSKTDLNISFIQNREELMEQSTKDTGRTKKEICLLISGHGMDSETLLQNKRALERGVKIKILSQHLTTENKEMLKNWQKMGMKVRIGETIGARLFIFDSEIIYITSYSYEQKNKAVGVRFKYPPLAQLMRELFAQRWAKAKEI